MLTLFCAIVFTAAAAAAEPLRQRQYRCPPRVKRDPDTLAADEQAAFYRGWESDLVS